MAAEPRRGLGIVQGLVALYAVVLAISWAVMLTRDDGAGPLGPGRLAIRTAPQDGSGQGVGAKAPGSVRVAYRDEGPRDAPVLLCLHGSPGSANDFRDLTPILAERFRVIAPDLPGFGDSSKAIPSVSIRAHAAYCFDLLDELGVGDVHAVGFSMGGGVALEMIDKDPARVRSLTLLASIGVIELELLGSHALNHGIHGLQLGAFRAARWLLPHFGALEDAMLWVPYARNFYDTDQRRLRPILEGLRLPTLIVHGEGDFLVPVAAAKEHGRIVPQSELVILPKPANHFLPWSHEEDVAKAVASFVATEQAGAGKVRGRANPARVAEAAVPFDPSGLPPFEGPALLTILVLLALATFVSEDLACIAAGLLVADGRIGFVAAALACFVGIFVGDMGLYLLGRVFGRPALNRRPLSYFVRESAVDRASRWFEAKGIGVIFLSRFTPGLRLPTYVAAGVLRTNATAFAFFFAVAGLIWTPALVGIAAVAGERLAEMIGGLGAKGLPFLLLLVVVLFQLYRLLPLTLTHKGRRLLRGKWKRLRHWEFWPPYVTYLPLVPWILWLAVKYRGISKVTAANPAMPAGGFVGESKADILRGLGRDEPEVAAFQLLMASDTPEVRSARASSFLAREDIELPVILKPNEGQRGSGVAQIAAEQEVLARARALDHDAILQKRIEGDEFGVFYTRHPEAERGSIFGVTVKVLPEVTGDGRRTVEELILDDPRACAMHATYCRELGPVIDDVLALGVTLPLVKVGTHSRGAIFLEGEHLITPALEDAIETISRRYGGFFFGRFDVRAPSPEAFSRGEGLGIIELNGVTSEATNVYDPRHSIREAYGILFRQWELAYSIGATNAARGAPTTGPMGIFAEWVRYRRKQRSHRT